MKRVAALVGQCLCHGRLRMIAGVAAMLALLTGFTYTPVPPGTTVFRYGEKEVPLEYRDGFEQVPENWVAEALIRHIYPDRLSELLGADYPVYLTEATYPAYGGTAGAMTGDGFIIVFGDPDPSVRRTIYEVQHELGHALHYVTMDRWKWREYAEIRGLDESYNPNAWYPYRKTWELFADDFVWLFGTETRGGDQWPMLGDSVKGYEWPYSVPDPNEVEGLRRWFLALTAPPQLKNADEWELALSGGNQPLTRGEWFLAMRLLPGTGEPVGAAQYRGGMPPWAAYAVSILVGRGWLIGYPDGSFREGQPVTRAEAAVMLARAVPLAAGQHLVLEDDRDQWPAWAAAEIRSMQAAGLLTADEQGAFRPCDPLTHEEALKALQAASKLLAGTSGALAKEGW